MPGKKKPIRILHYGLGAIGQNIARLVQKTSHLESAFAVDKNPDLIGQNLFEILTGAQTLPKRLKSVRVQGALQKNRAHVAIHSTSSWVKTIEPELRALIQSGYNVISTAEELVFPIGKNRDIVKKLDRLAKKKKVRVIGVGINPGFVLDLLPIVLSYASTEVESICAERFVDLRFRRIQLQKKVGVGMTRDEFLKNSKSLSFGHQGMLESLAMLAQGAGIPLTQMKKDIEPVFAENDLQTETLRVKAGQVAGLGQTARGFYRGKEKLRLVVRMVVGNEAVKNKTQNLDRITIQGNPSIHLEIPGGIAGEAGTASMVINATSRLLKNPPGFHTLLDL
jgi:4-hydroxy-tetrahydrodipicolinate reductase